MESQWRTQIEQRIGRNLLRYPMVEARLKTVLPSHVCARTVEVQSAKRLR